MSQTDEAMGILRASICAGKLCFYVGTNKAIDKVRETCQKLALLGCMCDS